MNNNPEPRPMSLQHSLFLKGLINFLMPYVMAFSPDPAIARSEILKTIQSYGVRTRAEALNAVQILAFGLSALDTLAEAGATEMSPAMRLRFRGGANALNRACQQNEKALAKRLACDVPDAAGHDAAGLGAAGPGAAGPRVEPINDVTQQQAQDVLQQATAMIDTTRNRLSGARPATGPHALPPSKPGGKGGIWDGIMTNALNEAVSSASPV